MAYTYKVWIVDGKEHFEYGNGQTRKKDFLRLSMKLTVAPAKNMTTMLL